MSARYYFVAACVAITLACTSDGAKLVELKRFYDSASTRTPGLSPPLELQELGFLSGMPRSAIEAQLGPSEAWTGFQQVPQDHRWSATTCARYRFYKEFGPGYELLVRFGQDGRCAVAHWSPIM